MKCMLCGKENPDDALYCGGCGWPQKKQKKSSGLRIVLIGCAAVALLAVLAVILFHHAKTDPAAPTEPPAASETATEAPTEETAAPTSDTEAPTGESLAGPVPAQGRIYEKVAEAFIETYWENDLPTLETLTEYRLYGYLEEGLDTGREIACTATAVESAPCDGERLMNIQMSLGITVKEAYAVTVDYETAEKSDTTVITVGLVNESWVVVSFAQFIMD